MGETRGLMNIGGQAAPEDDKGRGWNWGGRIFIKTFFRMLARSYNAIVIHDIVFYIKTYFAAWIGPS
jgi:hypothetical protein